MTISKRGITAAFIRASHADPQAGRAVRATPQHCLSLHLVALARAGPQSLCQHQPDCTPHPDFLLSVYP